VRITVNATATYSVLIGASEPLGPQHRVHEIHERGNAEQQREEGHRLAYTRSQNATNPSIAANVARPRTTIPSVNMAPSSASWRDVGIELLATMAPAHRCHLTRSTECRDGGIRKA